MEHGFPQPVLRTKHEGQTGKDLAFTSDVQRMRYVAKTETFRLLCWKKGTAGEEGKMTDIGTTRALRFQA